MSRTPNGLTRLVLRGQTQFLRFNLSLHGLQVQHGRRASHIEEVLTYPLVSCPPTLAGSEVGQAMLHLHPLAQLGPPRARRRPLAQVVLEGLVLPHAHRTAAPQGCRRTLCPQGAAVTLGGWELDHRPQAKG